MSVGEVIAKMRSDAERPTLVQMLQPFFNARYYYMFDSMGFMWDNMTGVPAYRKAVTAQIATGFCNSVDAVELHLE